MVCATRWIHEVDRCSIKLKTDAMRELPSDIHWMPAWQIREAVVARRLSAIEVACHFIERIEKLDRRLHSFFTVSGEMALDQARDIDRRIDRGEPVGRPGGCAGVDQGSVLDQGYPHHQRLAGSMPTTCRRTIRYTSRA